MRSKRQSITGKRGESQVAKELMRLGFFMVKKIGTPVKLTPHPSQPGYYRVIWGEKVDGDFHAICPGGRNVLIEAKTTTGGENLAYSQFEPHQIKSLDENRDLGGLSLVVWVRKETETIYVMRWPFPCVFEPRKSITPEYAAGLDLSFKDKIKQWRMI